MRDETLCLHAGYHPKNAEPRVIPIVQSTRIRMIDAVAARMDATGGAYSRGRNAVLYCSA